MNTFLFSVAFVSSCLIDYAQVVRDERAAALQLGLLGASAWREHEVASMQDERKGWPTVPPRGALLLRQILGDDIFDPIQSVQFNNTVSDKNLAVLRGCRKLDTLFLGQTSVTDLGIENILECQSLQILDLDGTRITDRGLARLSRLNLIYLSIAGTSVSEKAIAELQRSEPQCEVNRRRMP
jgi:Leucine-rich repeat (LRR) protein